MKIHIFGGTFNPPHLAHTQIIQRVNEIIKPDINYIIPALAWQKTNILNAKNRFEMCELAFDFLDNIVISDIEIKLNKPSYTIETLAKFKHKYPESIIYFTVGLDQLINIHTWHKWQELTKYANLYIVNRSSLKINKDIYKSIQNTDVKVWLLNNIKYIYDRISQDTLGSNSIILDDWQPLNISSTQVRELIKQCNWQNLESCLALPIINYIVKHNLYS